MKIPFDHLFTRLMVFSWPHSTVCQLAAPADRCICGKAALEGLLTGINEPFRLVALTQKPADQESIRTSVLNLRDELLNRPRDTIDVTEVVFKLNSCIFSHIHCRMQVAVHISPTPRSTRSCVRSYSPHSSASP